MSFKRLKGQGGPNPFFNPHTIYFFHRPVQINGKTSKIHALPTLIHHKDFQRGLRPDFNINDIKHYEEFQTHAFQLNNARQNFAIPFTPNWLYYPIDYQMSLDEDLMFYGERRRLASYETKPMKQEPPELQTQECPPEYFQDAQLPDDSMNIDEIGKMIDIDVNDDSQKNYEEPEDEYICPDDHYGCCEKHIIEFEIDH
ncbi:unnamed protein product [Eruca vesicaria subsp. sativa]|uniref:Uncharacterized protein n=1 Tax=Eruca vesicaria subsp. sativa TaxID=29727 RepID=A0ABC8M5M1_ERUVS|nr:unnamed protein product [Eruca vesicaria subsp. sativa]